MNLWGNWASNFKTFHFKEILRATAAQSPLDFQGMPWKTRQTAAENQLKQFLKQSAVCKHDTIA